MKTYQKIIVTFTISILIIFASLFFIRNYGGLIMRDHHNFGLQDDFSCYQILNFIFKNEAYTTCTSDIPIPDIPPGVRTYDPGVKNK